MVTNAKQAGPADKMGENTEGWFILNQPISKVFRDDYRPKTKQTNASLHHNNIISTFPLPGIRSSFTVGDRHAGRLPTSQR